jgi:putative MATE family efflux protein
MGSPDEVIELAALYMRIYFLGAPFFMVYTFGSAVMRSRGDTRRPMIYLIIAGASNVLLNLLLVVVFHMGVAGVALGTVLSQIISSVLVVQRLFRLSSDDPCKLRFTNLRIHIPFLLQMLRCGLPAGIQSALFSLSNVLIQSSINSLGPVVMAGNGAAMNVEGFLYQMMYAFSYATVSFVGQNVGAGKHRRTLTVLRDAVLLVGGMAAVMGAALTALGPKVLLLYLPDAPEAVAAGVARMRIVCRFYFLCGMMDTLCGTLRALNRSITSMVISLTFTCGLRILWIHTVFAHFKTPESLFFAYPVSWLLSCAVHVIFIVYAAKKLIKAESSANPLNLEEG